MSSKTVGYKRIDRCRISNSQNLVTVLDLGFQHLTGVFPKRQDEAITSGPLELVWCPDSGLLQLAHSFEPQEMYGENYGYRSGLNQSMVDHLTRKIGQLTRRAGQAGRYGARYRLERLHVAQSLPGQRA